MNGKRFCDPPSTCACCGADEDRERLYCFRCGARYVDRYCSVCKEKFAPTTGTQRFCSVECREVAYPRPLKGKQLRCRICQEIFAPRRPNQEICSSGCRRHYLRQRAQSRLGRRDPYLASLLNDPCTYCGGRPVTGFDHVIPKIDGGPDDWTNLVPCCHTCNASKCAKPLLLFLRGRRRDPVAA